MSIANDIGSRNSPSTENSEQAMERDNKLYMLTCFNNQVTKHGCGLIDGSVVPKMRARSLKGL